MATVFFNRTDRNVIKDPTSRGNFHINDSEFKVSNDGSFAITVRGIVESGGGGINFKYSADPARNNFSVGIFSRSISLLIRIKHIHGYFSESGS